MISFKEYYITEQKNTHMTHIEDSVIYGGVDGTREAINALRELRDMLKGVKDGSISVKWDGAPSIFAGIDPNDNRFFVAKKSIFNKNPKVYKSDSDIDADTSGDLNTKLKMALRYLPELGITDVLQGDFLFSQSDLKKEKIDGENYITFHPNTIVYAVPEDSPEAKEILNAKIGIVWHTRYSGSSFEDMEASYKVNVEKLNPSKNVWYQDAMLKDVTNATLSSKETEEVNKDLSQAGKIFNRISGNVLRSLEANQELAKLIETFNNTYVRKGQVVKDTRSHVDNLIQWIYDRYEKQIQSRKSEKGKLAQQKKRDEILSFFSKKNKDYLKLIFDLQKLIISAKLKLINKLNKVQIQNTGTFVKTANGFRVSGHEGFVAIDKLGSNVLKIVDRMEFSHNNFSPEILKGWDKPNR